MRNETPACPALLVAAPASGQGKTTVTAALARLHARQGRQVRVFKCGPDFLDPHWLELASGHPVHPLDLWMTGAQDCAGRLHAAAREAGLLLVEGVMGLYDGTPSAADIALRFGLPVLAVIDAWAMAQTFGALAHGLQAYREGLRWAGVLANRVAGEGHAALLRTSLRDEAHWLGALQWAPELSWPERHLGLAQSGETADALQRLDAMADRLAATPLGRMAPADLGPWRTSFEAPAASSPPPALLAGRTIAIARDAAFQFVYAANLDCLTVLGARLVFFSPIAGDALPACDAVWLPGGYPELHVHALGQARALRDALARHVQAGKPLSAECGGMMALFERIATAEGAVHALWGLLPGTVRMQQRPAAVGPQQLALAQGTLRGHSFHFSRCETALAPALHASAPDGRAGEPVWRRGPLLATYFHAWFPSCPQAAAAILRGEEILA
ncbi:cobyrinate a,c-diamide synthase [Ramlibacter alkalitolerans]